MRRRLAISALAGALVLTGCGGSDDAGDAPDNGSTAQQDVTTQDTTDDDTAADDGVSDDEATDDAAGETSDETPEGTDDAGTDDGDGSGSDASAAASGTTQLDISERHASGTMLDITSITIEERSVSLEAEFFNGGPAVRHHPGWERDRPYRRERPHLSVHPT